MKTKSKYYKFFTDCIPVKGYSRSIIYDMTRKKINYIPNSLFEIVKDGVIDIDKFIDLSIDETEVFNEYIEFLIENEYIFEISELSEADHFPNIDLKFDYPSKISNAILDYNGDYDLFKNCISELNNLNCNFIILRILTKTEVTELLKLISIFNDTVIFSIDIIIDYTEGFTEEKLREIIMDYPRINIITIFKNVKNHIDNSLLNNGLGHIIYTKKEYNKKELIKIKNEDYFVINMKVFTESILKNNFFNKKVYISEKGNVKNSPFSDIIFGNIKKINLEKIIIKNNFKKLWNVKKDLIDVCKDCEYRYMCIDNRNPSERGENHWYFEDECDYNPYINKWRFDENYFNLHDSGITSTKEEFSIDNVKLNETLNKIWK